MDLSSTEYMTVQTGHNDPEGGAYKYLFSPHTPSPFNPLLFVEEAPPKKKPTWKRRDSWSRQLSKSASACMNLAKASTSPPKGLKIKKSPPGRSRCWLVSGTSCGGFVTAEQRNSEYQV